MVCSSYDSPAGVAHTIGTARKAKRDNEVQSEIGSRGMVFARSQEGGSAKGQFGFLAPQFIHIIGVLLVRRRRVCGFSCQAISGFRARRSGRLTQSWAIHRRYLVVDDLGDGQGDRPIGHPERDVGCGS
jgi:hypothetical protein